ncbi:RluA family pseudouridine synthase [Cupriavidus taiwanensis]|uniref:RluA family pseudouridine synthase n=1 Tax=Cupriavidus taiwanensis TaxID=164546 RepID=UPI000E10BE99|nr:RluA family pseudouridine synthase [Cupriavidus taiwanensis]SOY42716.1 23S rRNA pseudouridine synthase [Cupriavidus taiwanensis]SOY58812.1 23S rRNA pseudouridine synthase [Cupriavidus taiwanensis]SOY80047.1 23S rRNA pseudouridine synthase [Cupriavidus taiwanensis]SOZ50783.1 23S rRNA pseudouridine synthase [Cupriavidus taiwanensis]SOZ75934.1 23S rRNA pseudouridine synthase [Cupriavidus taiwanensis]
MKKNSVKHYSPSPQPNPQAGDGVGGLPPERVRAAAVVADFEAGAEEFDDAADAPAAAADPAVTLSLEVDSASHGERLDKLLARHFSEFSRSRLQQWIESGAVRVDGQVRRPRDAVQMGNRIEVRPQAAPESSAFAPEDVPLDVVYEDGTLLVINKPAGLVVHPAAGNWSGTVLNGLLHRDSGAASLPRAGIVHRLDKETSGLMVVARTLTAQTDLVRQLQARTVKRTYIALVWGRTYDEGTIDAPIGRDPRERTRMAIVQTASGKPSRTHFRTLATVPLGRGFVSMVMCKLETGRTHQIRVHFESIGHPLVGDPVYFRATQRGQRPAIRVPLPVPYARQALHAYKLGLVHPATGKHMSWTAQPPEDLQALIDALDFESAQADDEDEAWDEVWEGGEAHWEYAGDDDDDDGDDDERDA